MVKTSITPQQTDISISVPEKYVGKKLEVLVYAVEELIDEEPKKSGMANFWGIISDETAHELHQQVEKGRNEWDRDI